MKLKENRKSRRYSARLDRRADTVARKCESFIREDDERLQSAIYRAYHAGRITKQQALASGCHFGGIE